MALLASALISLLCAGVSVGAERLRNGIASQRYYPSAPLPADYPQAFSISFLSNVTQLMLDHPITGALYYDWSLKSQRIDHGSGSYECVHFYNTTKPCSLIFVPGDGMYRILHDSDVEQIRHREPVTERNLNPEIHVEGKIRSRNNRRRASMSSDVDCCLDLQNIGTPPPDWATRSNPTFNGIVYDEFSRTYAYDWVFDHEGGVNFPFHSARQAVESTEAAPPGTPLTFTFPGKANGFQDYHYDLATMSLTRPNASKFELPRSCKARLCTERL